MARSTRQEFRTFVPAPPRAIMIPCHFLATQCDMPWFVPRPALVVMQCDVMSSCHDPRGVRAGKVARQDWRHSWTAMSFSSCWLQKLSRSIAVAKQTAFGALRRTTLCTRQRVLGGANASGDGDYESVTMGRAAAM